MTHWRLSSLKRSLCSALPHLCYYFVFFGLLTALLSTSPGVTSGSRGLLVLWPFYFPTAQGIFCLFLRQVNNKLPLPSHNRSKINNTSVTLLGFRISDVMQKFTERFIQEMNAGKRQWWLKQGWQPGGLYHPLLQVHTPKKSRRIRRDKNDWEKMSDCFPPTIDPQGIDGVFSTRILHATYFQ